ncbi:MAG: response regulator [bacterium]|nr:response regulator [bacterium]
MTKKVMIIDDNQTNLKIMDLVLTKAGYKTDTVINPKFAFDVIKEAKPDVLLLDINMPEVNGFQICKALKKDPELQYIPIIFVSALDQTEYISMGLSLGAVDYITKPIKAEELVARVDVQYRLAYVHKKLRRTNDSLSNQVFENSDMQEDLLYSLVKLKQGEKGNPKHYERIKDFCEYAIKKTAQDSMYENEIDDELITNSLYETFKK